MNWARIRTLLGFLALMALPLLAAAASLDGPAQLPVSAPRDLAWLRDPGGEMGLAGAQSALERFQPAGNRTLSFGFSRSAYWLHFTLQSRATARTTLYLSIAQPTLDDVRLYQVQNGQLLRGAQAGDELPQSEHTFPGPYPILPIELAPGGRSEIYVRVASRMGVLQLPMQLQSLAQVEQSMRTSILLDGIYLGVFAALFLYNLLLAASLRRLAYVYYVALLPLQYLVFAATSGFGSWMIYPSWVWPANQGLVICVTAELLVGLQFARHLLYTARNPQLDRLLRASGVLVAVLLLAAPLAPTGLVYPALLGAAMLATLIGLYAGVVCLVHNHPQARFYVLAQLAASIGTLVLGLTTTGLARYTYASRQVWLLGATLQALLLALALGDRIRALQRATHHAENARREVIATHEQELERGVEERTRELEEARRHAEHLATTDALTGIYNRRGLLPALQDAIERSVQLGSPLSLISFDLDRFKRVNDDFGHAEGDRVLRQIVEMIRTLIQPQDLFGRLGGEEFLLGVGASSEQAVQIAERLRKHLEGGLRAGSELRPVTASFGVASLSRRLSTLEGLQRGADAALYQAKRREGNCVELYSGGTETTPTRAIMLRTRAANETPGA